MASVGMVVIGAVFGVEGFADVFGLCALVLQHMGDDRVAVDEDAGRFDLCRQVAVADVPSQLQQMRGVAGADFGEVFGGGDHFDQTAILQLQAIAVVQVGGYFEIDEDFAAIWHGQQFAPDVALFGVEGDAVPRGSGCGDGCGAKRGQNRKYLCAIGNTFAGSQTSNSPSARTS